MNIFLLGLLYLAKPAAADDSYKYFKLSENVVLQSTCGNPDHVTEHTIVRDALNEGECKLPDGAQLHVISREWESIEHSPIGVETYIFEYRGGKTPCRFKASLMSNPATKFTLESKGEAKQNSCIVSADDANNGRNAASVKSGR